MNLQDRFMEFYLSLKDKVLNALTLGWWNRSQGSKRVYIYK